MKTVIVKATTTGSRETGDLRPIISDYVPTGVGLCCMEYGDGYCIVKVSWSDHPLVDVKPDPAELAKFLANVTIIETIKPQDYPKAKELKRKFLILADAVEEIPDKKVKVKKTGKEGSFIRKEKGRHEEEFYLLDEG